VSNSSSDAALELLRVCRDGIRFRLGAELHLPGQNYKRPRPPDQPLPVKTVWITAASPPPTRDGLPWEWGLLLKDSGAGGSTREFRPTGRGSEESDEWRERGVDWVEDIPQLDEPQPATIVLNQALLVPFEWEREMTFEATPDRLGFLSKRYKQPYEYQEGSTALTVGVSYYGEFTLPWSRGLTPGDWVAISLDDRFTPPGRTSVDFIAQVNACNLFAPPTGPRAAFPTQSATAAVSLAQVDQGS
jgi:hypothetical protein